MLHLQAKNCITSRKQCKTILLLLLIDFVFIVTLFLIFSHIKTIISFLFCSFKTKSFHLLDDFHIVNVFVHPSKKASSTIHMTSSLLDIQQPDYCYSATSIKCKGHSLSGRDHKGFHLGRNGRILTKLWQHESWYTASWFLHVKPDRVQQQLHELR